MKKRRWGESGSKCRSNPRTRMSSPTSRSCAGVVSASRAAGTEHPSCLGEQELHVAHVLEGLGAEDEVEHRVLEW